MNFLLNILEVRVIGQRGGFFLRCCHNNLQFLAKSIKNLKHNLSYLKIFVIEFYPLIHQEIY